MDNVIPLNDDLDPSIGAALGRAYRTEVDVELAAQHLWTIECAARRRADQGRRQRGRLRQTAVAAISGVMMLSSSGAAVAASNQSIPGDVLYSVKRSAERAQLLLSSSAASDARLHLSFAQRRVHEATRLASTRPDEAVRLLDEAVAQFQTAEQVGGHEFAPVVAAVRVEVVERLPVIAEASGVDMTAAVEQLTAQPTPADVVAASPSPSATASPPLLVAAPTDADTSTTDTTDTASETASPTDVTTSETPAATATPTATPTASPTTEPSTAPSRGSTTRVDAPSAPGSAAEFDDVERPERRPDPEPEPEAAPEPAPEPTPEPSEAPSAPQRGVGPAHRWQGDGTAPDEAPSA